MADVRERTDTVLGQLAERARSHPEDDVLLYKLHGRWQVTKQAELMNRVTELALGLQDLGIGPGDTVALMLAPHSTRVFSALAVQLAGARAVGQHGGVPRDELSHVLTDSCATWILVQGATEADLVLELADAGKLPDLKYIRYADPAFVQDYVDPRGLLGPLGDIERAGADALNSRPGALAELLAALDPDQEAAINYTSGTTGLPRGVVMTHANIAAATAATIQAFGLGRGDRVLSFRPMSDPVEPGATIFASLVSGAVLALPENRATVRQAMWEIAPTYLHLTPRYVKEIASDVRLRMQATRGLKRTVTRSWQRSFVRSLLAGQGGTSFLTRRLVGGRVLEKLGLDKVRWVVVSGTQIPPEAIGFFRALGVQVRPAYSLAEAGGYAIAPTGDRVRGDTLGKPLPGFEVRVQDGELLLRGAAVARNYAAGRERVPAVDAEGWLHTGDAAYEVDGEIAVPGRLSENITLPDGAQVNAAEVESALRASPYIREALLDFGGGRVVVMVEPAMATLRGWAAKRGLEFTTDRSLTELPEARHLLKQAVEAAVAQFSTLKVDEVRVLDAPLDVASGTLTPTDKVRRSHASRAQFIGSPGPSDPTVATRSPESAPVQ